MNRLARLPRTTAGAVLGFVKRHRAYSAIVLGLTGITALYYAVFNSDRYVSEARLIVEHESSSAAVPSAAFGLLGLSGGGAVADSLLIERFVESPAMLEHLEAELGMRAHFSQDSIDWFSRLDSEASREQFFKYYLKRVEVDVDEESQTLDLKVQADDPEFAQLMASAIVRRSEQFVNDISHTLAREQIAFAQRELDMMYERVQQTSAAMLELQNKEGVFSPEVENESISAIIAGLQQQLSQTRTEYKALTAYLSDTAPEVVAARKKIDAIQGQIAQERAKQVGDSKDERLNQQLLRFQELKLNAQIALDIYQTGLKTLEAARLDATRKVKYLVSVSPATLPDAAAMPRRWYIVISVFIVLNILYAIGGLLIATINDHRE